jgi:hypothetical protein
VEPPLSDRVGELVAMFRDDSGAVWFARAVVAACVLAVLLPRTREAPPTSDRLEAPTPRWRDRDGGPSPLATTALILAFCAVSFLYACLYVQLW